MYANHAAREDTIIFPAWENALSRHELDEMGVPPEVREFLLECIDSVGQLEALILLREAPQQELTHFTKVKHVPASDSYLRS
jgi:hypothetical protein